MAWAVVAGATIATVGGALLADDNGAEGANNAAADSTRLQGEIARDQWNRYKEIYEPLERGMVTDAQNYDSPENYARAAGDASATVSSQFSKARDRLGRTPGLDPSSGAYQASLVGLDLAQAASDATQQNAARQKVTDTAYARKTDALSLGKGLPAQASSALATSANSSLAQAQFGQTNANNQAGAFGRITERVFSSPSMSNWLGNANVRSDTAANLQNNGGFGTGNAYGNQDLGAFL
jgi:gas vesicle protein